MVLRRGPDHRRPADVDLLDDVVLPGPRLYGLDERVQVDDHEVEGLDAQFGELVDVFLPASVGEDPGVDLRVQGLDAPVEALLEARDLGDLGDRHPDCGDALRGGSGGYDRHSGTIQSQCQLLQSRLVEHRDQCSSDGNAVKVGQGHANLRLVFGMGPSQVYSGSNRVRTKNGFRAGQRSLLRTG